MYIPLAGPIHSKANLNSPAYARACVQASNCLRLLLLTNPPRTPIRVPNPCAPLAIAAARERRECTARCRKEAAKSRGCIWRDHPPSNGEAAYWRQVLCGRSLHTSASAPKSGARPPIGCRHSGHASRCCRCARTRAPQGRQERGGLQAARALLGIGQLCRGFFHLGRHLGVYEARRRRPRPEVPPPLARPRPTAPGASLTRSCGGTLDVESAARNLRVSQPPAVSPTPTCAATLPKFTHNSVKGTRRLESLESFRTPSARCAAAFAVIPQSPRRNW
jgi:hypothetical protein